MDICSRYNESGFCYGDKEMLKKTRAHRFILLILYFWFAPQTAFAKDCWIGAWVSAQQLTEPKNMPPKPGLSDNTLRQVIHVSLGGSRLRIQFSNEYGNAPVTINAAHLAISKGGSKIDPATDKTLMFNGTPSVTIKARETVYSDALDFNPDLSGFSNLAVSIFFGQTPANLTGHPGSRSASYIQAGDAVSAEDMNSAVKTDHWYILSGVDVWLDNSYARVVVLGDSISDGLGSTVNGNNRWPDNLARRLAADSNTAKIGVLNQGIGGNSLVFGGLGPTAKSRFKRDVLDHYGVRWVIIQMGVNDIGTSKDVNVASGLIVAYEQLIDKAHNQNILVYGLPVLPFARSFYDSNDHLAARQAVNKWIRTSGKFDAVIDLDTVIRDTENPDRLLKAYDSGDHLHLSVAGYKKMADSIDLNLFVPKKAGGN